METPAHIIDTCGEDAIIAAIGVDRKRVQKARREPQLPSLWFDALERLAGQPLPRHLFTFKGLDGGRQ
jgi:hypothetical protein